MIDAVESLRRDSKLKIHRHLMSFNHGIFEVDHPEIVAISFCKEHFSEGTLSQDAAELTKPPMVKTIQNQNIAWSQEMIGDIILWMACSNTF